MSANKYYNLVLNFSLSKQIALNLRLRIPDYATHSEEDKSTHVFVTIFYLSIFVKLLASP